MNTHEKAARALHASEPSDWDWENVDQRPYFARVDAVLRAIREPSDAMSNAGLDAQERGADLAWQAMIDTILNGEG